MGVTFSEWEAEVTLWSRALKNIISWLGNYLFLLKMVKNANIEKLMQVFFFETCDGMKRYSSKTKLEISNERLCNWWLNLGTNERFGLTLSPGANITVEKVRWTRGKEYRSYRSSAQLPNVSQFQQTSSTQSWTSGVLRLNS